MTHRTPQKSAGRSGVGLSELAHRLASLGYGCEAVAAGSTVVTGVTDDSREVEPGDLFVALPGHRTDGVRYATEALRAGAVAVASSPGDASDGVPTLVVNDVRRAAGQLAAMILGEPAARLELVGVTGTNGKTSCAYLLESIWRAARVPCGLAGTVVQRWPGWEHRASMTTPPAVSLQKMLAAMADAGCRHAVLEVSSHALVQHRVSGCLFEAAVFTNLTRDHLDYHGNEEAYFEAKAMLFREYARPNGPAVINADDPWGVRLIEAVDRNRVWTYSAAGDTGADARVVRADCGLEGIRARLDIRGRGIDVRSRFVGRVNLANLLAAATAAVALGVGIDDIEEGLRICPPVPGRLERVGTGRPIVFVDYAHTPDALERVLAAVEPVPGGRRIVVFGCGGDRDRGKRPMMGGIGASRAHVVVLTSDNPRSEVPEAIIADIEEGIGTRMGMCTLEEAGAGATGYLIEPDRERAIALAVAVAGERDVVIVAGKGHEDYQEVAGVRHPFDDREVVSRLLGKP